MDPDEKQEQEVSSPRPHPGTAEASAWALGAGCLIGFFFSRAFQTKCCPPPRYEVTMTTKGPCGSETIEEWVMNGKGVIDKGPVGSGVFSKWTAVSNVNAWWLLLSVLLFLFTLAVILGCHTKEKENAKKRKAQDEGISDGKWDSEWHQE